MCSFREIEEFYGNTVTSTESSLQGGSEYMFLIIICGIFRLKRTEDEQEIQVDLEEDLLPR